MNTQRFTVGHRLAATASILAILLLGGCWARVPARFEPPPPRLDPADLEVNDLSGRDHIVMLVFGDSGTGNDSQRELGNRMASVCAARACDLAVMLGDNFYARGVRPPSEGVWDEAFTQKFEAPYAGLPEIQFWAVAGNHDWFGGRASVDTQVAYSLQSARWRMPAYDYAIPRLPAWLTVYALDTVVLMSGAEIGQLERARDTLCDAPGWRVVTGHHPVYSTGPYGSVGGGNPARSALLPLFEECGVDLYLAGHEHHQEHLRAGDLDQIVQGAAGRPRNVDVRRQTRPARQLFAASRLGFALLDIRRDAIEVEFFGYPPGSLRAFGSLYRATIPSRRPAAAARR